MRQVIIGILKNEPNIQVVGYARNGEEALRKIAGLRPHVVTLDVEMPIMDGLTTLKVLMKENPVPVVMLSALTTAHADVTIRALELGAVDFILKPAKREDITELADVLPNKIRAAARAPVRQFCGDKSSREIVPASFISTPKSGKVEIIAIGTSTGGPSALQRVLTGLPGNLPAGIVIVQHMPRGFTAPLAKRLNQLSQLEIREAEPDDVIKPGLALIAPAGKQMVLVRQAGKVQVRLQEEADINTLFKPSVDVLFLSVAKEYKARSLGVILTGMGNDGVRGLTAIKEEGGRVLAQDEASCIVYGMPKAAVEKGVVDKVIPLSEMAKEIVETVTK
ncbi:MAG: two-component system, chemotaxis family, protein-glutamate methylesterase/glutaminase [Clostridia bacterium]|nr:two-component system, chemotaxis family, protein-glutamate methylesterase/glutaminase [Clostridia bacterium]